MLAIGMAERALERLCRRAMSRTAFGMPLSEQANVRDWIAEARIEIEKSRLLVFKAAWMIDTVGKRTSLTGVAAIKVDGPNVALKIVDHTIWVHGGACVTDDVPFGRFWGAPCVSPPD